MVNASSSDIPLTVGIGASAGGLDALKTFFNSFSKDPGMAFIVIVHLSPDYGSSMAELLQAETSLKVMQVNEKTEIEENCVYVIPPNKILTVGDNHLELSNPDNGRSHVIDQFYRSLGDIKGDRAVCITLSGSGSDGATGMKTIKENGGLTIVQDPAEAEYRGMPQSAIDTGLTDKVLSVKEMPQALMDYKRSLNAVRIADTPEELTENEEDVLAELFEKVQAETKHDFNHYKRTTILRRIKRRMHVHSVTTLDEYLAVLNEDPGETQELFKDLLISVTNFFRDPEAFEALEEEVIPKLFKGKNPDDDLRVWVPGCATGEEAYSIAMLLHKYARNISDPPSLQIFATDIDQQALDVAREGRYPESIADDLTEQRLQRYFTKYGYEYVVREELRDLVIFSKHDLLRNPPFLNQDLISCRNLLIYLDRNLQSEVFNLFHYALKPTGVLFLGKSDSNLQAAELFSSIDKDHRIYQKKSESKSTVHLPSFPLKFSPNKPSGSHSWTLPSKTKASFDQLHQRLMSRQFAPPSVIINDSEEVLHATKGIGRYTGHSEGEPSRQILDIVIPDLRQPLRSILYRIKKNEIEFPVRKQVWVKINQQSELIALHVDRIREKDFPDDLIHIVFQKMRDGDGSDDEIAEKTDFSEDETEIIEELENELKQTKEQLELTIEGYETSNEELRSSNEELQSMNEELQSTTEELETSKEELQSVNEELKSVNSELESKIDDLSRANSDLKNLMEATEMAILFVDRDFCLRRFTSTATDIFNLTPSDLGRPLDHFTHQLQYDSIMADIKNVLNDLEKTRKEVTDKEGNAYIMRLRPYQTVDGNINGVVITFVDITELKEAEEALRRNEEKYRTLVKNYPNGAVALFDSDLRYTAIGGKLFDTAEFDPEDYIGSKIFEIYSDECVDEIKPHFLATLKGETRKFEIQQQNRHLLAQTLPIENGTGEVTSGMLVLLDITERKQAQKELERMNETLEKRVEEKTQSLLSYQDKLRSLAFQLSQTEAKQREKLATELHDNLGQLLALGKMKINELQKGSSKEAPTVDELKQIMDDAIQYTRELTSDLKPPSSIKNDIRSNLNWLVEKFTKHNLTVTIDDDKQPKPLKDKVRLTVIQSVRELLFNVLKHTSQKKATIRLGRSEDQLQLTVEDEGEGFDPKKKELASTTGGSFGLFNIQERIDLLGGQVDIASKKGHGTKVTLFVPLSEDHSDIAKTKQIEEDGLSKITEPSQKKRGEKTTILLVDDHKMFRKGLCKIIGEEDDMEVIGEAGNGKEAVRMCRDNSPDVILMDVNMPEMDGIEATHRISSDMPNVCIIGVSLHDSSEVEEDMREAGASAFLTKTEAYESLVMTIRAEVSASNSNQS